MRTLGLVASERTSETGKVSASDFDRGAT